MPLRQGNLRVGKYNSLLVGLGICGFLLFQSIDANLTKDNWYIRSKDIDNNTLLICSGTLLLILGINIKEELFAIAAIVSRNSINIATLAQQNNVQLEKDKEIETTEEDSQNNNN